MLERLAPATLLRRRIAPMTLVGDDDVEGVDWNREYARVCFLVGIAPQLNVLWRAKKVDTHALYGADVDKRLRPVRVGQV